VDELIQQIKPEYDVIVRNVALFSKRKRLVAEIDVLAFKDGVCDVYEVKCSHRVSKAKRQLVKIKKLLSKNHCVGEAFFYCGASQLLIPLSKQQLRLRNCKPY
jgi:predicted RecB family endonuclease